MGLKTLLSGQTVSIPYTHKALSDGNLSDKFFSSVGVPVHSFRPSQNMPLLRVALAAIGQDNFEDDYDLLVHGAGPAFHNEFEVQIKKILHKDAAEYRLREKPKSLFRMRDKEGAEGEGAVCAGSHTDINAAVIYAKNLESFVRLTDRLRPANNSHVAQFKEKAANPDKSTNFPGNTAKLVIERNFGALKNVPFVTEIIVLMDGCQDYYETTHKAVETQRGLSKFFGSERRGIEDMDVQLAACDLMGHAMKDIPKINQKMSKMTGMDSLAHHRQYHLVDDVPVTHVTTKSGENFCFVPNPETGFYEREDSYLGKINRNTLSSRKDFLLMSHAMVPPPKPESLLGLTGPLVLKVA